MAMTKIEKARPISLNDLEKLKSEIEQSIKALISDIPKGAIMWFNLTSAPVGWAICDGTNGTPNLIGRYPLGATSGIGSMVAAGLPNITGETITEGVSYAGKAQHDKVNVGAFYVGSTTINDIPTGSEHNGGRTTLYFDASKGTVDNNGNYLSKDNSPYGKSSTVTPPSVKLLPCMKL